MPTSHAYPPYIEGIIFDATGKPAAGGTVEAYVAGSSVPTPLWSTSEPATSLGPVVTIDGAGRAAFRLREGYAYKLRAKDADGALIWERDNVKCPLDGGGVNIPNPMESTGDMIVGGTDGQPERLAPGDEGDALQIVSGVPTYAPVTGDHKVLGASGDNSPDYLDQKLIALAPLSKDVLNAAGNKMVRLQLTKGTDGQALKTYTDGGQLKVGWRDDEDGKVSVDGTDTPGYLEDKVTAGTGVAITKSSGQLVVSATGADTNEVKTSASDDHPGYLQSKVLAGDLIRVDKEQTPDGDGGYEENLRVHLKANGVTAGYVPTADGSDGVAWAAPATQPGDHHVVVTNADASAGTLADKLVAGSNVTLTPVTDGDGVQTLEIAATGGGGGGSGTLRQTIFRPYLFKTRSVSISYAWVFFVFPETEYIDGFETIFSSDKTTIPSPFDCAIFEGNVRSTATKISGASTKYFRSSMSYFRVFGGTFNTPVHIDPTKGHWVYLLTGPFGGAYFAEQIYGTVTSSTDTIGSMSNAASIPNTLGSINDSDGIMPAFTLIGHN